MAKEERKSERNAAVHAHQLVTRADLEKFKDHMLDELRIMLKPGSTA